MTAEMGAVKVKIMWPDQDSDTFQKLLGPARRERSACLHIRSLIPNACIKHRRSLACL